MKLAEFSADRTYRYVLRRPIAGGDGTTCAFIMLNPSTADEHKLDPTVTRCLDYATRWGHSQLTVLNLFPFRATDPREMKAHKELPRTNQTNLDWWCGETLESWVTRVVCAWGVNGVHLGRARFNSSVLARSDVIQPKLQALMLTKAGHPAHPLYLRRDLAPFAWRGY